MLVERTILQERLLGIIKRFPQQRIVVIGDSVADQFVHGAISRVSREAPVFILRHEHTDTVPGGAANCAVNLASLGATVSLISVTGNDEAGRTLIERLTAAGVDCSGVVTSDGLRTTTKVRILAGQLHSTRQQVIRIDYEGEPLNDVHIRERLQQSAAQHAKKVHAVIVSDYDYGVADAEMANVVRDVARELPLLADSRFNLPAYFRFTSATPNQDEVEHLFADGPLDDAQLESAAEQLRNDLGYRALLVTRGSHGMMLLEEGAPPVHIEAVGPLEPVDVTGAGDTVMATYALALSTDASFSDAARLANYAGGLVVMKRGTATITSDELANSVRNT